MPDNYVPIGEIPREEFEVPYVPPEERPKPEEEEPPPPPVPIGEIPIEEFEVPYVPPVPTPPEPEPEPPPPPVPIGYIPIEEFEVPYVPPPPEPKPPITMYEPWFEPVPEPEVPLGPDISKYEAIVDIRPDEVLVQMKEEGATVAQMATYIERHPDAPRGAGYKIGEDIRAQFEELAELRGEERVTTARTLGVLPEGFDELPQELKDAYAEGDKAFATAVEVYNRDIVARQKARTDVLRELNAVRDQFGRYDLQKAFDMGLGKKVYEARALGLFTDEDIVAAQFGAVEARRIERVTAKDIAEFEATHTRIKGTDEWIPNTVVASVREQSEHGYNILIGQGLDAYNKAISDALEELAEWKRPSGYRLKPAVAAGISRDTLSLLFPKEDVEKAWQVKRVREELVPEVEAQPVSGLPLGLIATLPVMGAVAVAEPTFIGEVILGIAILGGLYYATLQGKEIKWGALWDEITSVFKKETGREPTEAEIAELETTAASIITASALSIPDMPTAVAMKAIAPLPTLLPGTKAIAFPPIPGFAVTEPLPAVLIGTKPLEIPPLPGYAVVEPPPALPPFEGKMEFDNVMVAQTHVAVAEKELNDIFVIIRPKILKPGEFLPATVPKTVTALVALDAAVQDAFIAGEISEDTLRVYSQARARLLTKQALVDVASQAYIGGMQPQLASNIQNLAALALSLALSDIQDQANKAAIEAYNQALAQNMTQAQAQTAAQTAAQNAIKTATQTAIQQAIQTATQTATKTATQTAVKTLTKTATQTAVQTMVNTAVATATTTMTQTAVATATAIPIILPPLPGVEPSKRKPIEEGSYAWKQGMFWKYIPPPYDMDKPLTLPRGVAPKGARVGGRTPQETIQMIGKSREVPKDISIDMGIVDAFITKGGTQIAFTGKGLETDVGKRLPSPTQGMSVDGAYPGMPVSGEGISRPKISKKKPSKKGKRLTDYEYMTTLKGFRP